MRFLGKLKETATETSSLLREVCGREVRVALKFFDEMTPENASRHARSMWKCVQLPMEIPLKAVALTK
jgi:hypothetical protein